MLVAAHVLGSALVWVAALRFHLALTEPVPVATPVVDLVAPTSVAPAVS